MRVLLVVLVVLGLLAACVDARASKRVQSLSLNPPSSAAPSAAPGAGAINLCELCVFYADQYNAKAATLLKAGPAPDEKPLEAALSSAGSGCADSKLNAATRLECFNKFHHLLNKKNSNKLSVFGENYLNGCKKKDSAGNLVKVDHCPSVAVCAAPFEPSTDPSKPAKGFCGPVSDFVVAPFIPVSAAAASSPATAAPTRPGK